MPFNSETARAAQAKSVNGRGVRKDAISHGLWAMVQSKYGTFEAYFSHMDKIMPGKPFDAIAKYIPSEIEQTTNVQHNVLVVNMPEPRQLNTPEPVQVLGCTDSIESITDHPRKPDDNVNEHETIQDDTDG